MPTYKPIPFLVVALLLIATALALTAGLNSDEISYKIILERYFITGGLRENLRPFCTGTFLVAPPAVFVPAAAFWAQLTRLGSGWFSYRFLPWLSLATVLFILVRYNLRKNSRGFWPLFLVATLGTMPFFIMLRAEPILLAGCMILFFIGKRMLDEQRGLHLYLYGAVALLVYSVAAYVHPKALYLVAVPMISVLLSEMKPASRLQGIIYRVIFIFALSLLSYVAISMHQTVLSCREYPQLQELLNGFSANPMDIVFNPARFLSNLGRAFGLHSVDHTVTSLFYRAGIDAAFLPEKSVTTYADMAVNFFIAAAVAGLGIYVAAKSLTCLSRAKDATERKEIILIASVFVALTVPYIFGVQKEFYEVASFVWALMIAAVLLWPLEPNIAKNYRRTGIAALSALIALSVASDFLSYNNFVRAWLDGHREKDQVPYFLDRDALDREIREMMMGAHVGEKEPLVTSDLTYEAVKYHPYVVPTDYMTWGFLYLDPRTPHLVSAGDIRTYLKKLNVNYGVIECDAFAGQERYGAHLLARRRFTQTRDGRTNATFDICLFRVS